jgi:hypothetical protein
MPEQRMRRTGGRAAKREAHRRPAPAYALGGECEGDPAGRTLVLLLKRMMKSDPKI